MAPQVSGIFHLSIYLDLYDVLSTFVLAGFRYARAPSIMCFVRLSVTLIHPLNHAHDRIADFQSLLNERTLLLIKLPPNPVIHISLQPALDWERICPDLNAGLKPLWYDCKDANCFELGRQVFLGRAIQTVARSYSIGLK